MNILHEKLDKLKRLLGGLDGAAVAFSGGVDSTFLLCAARDALGERAVAITAKSCGLPMRELESAAAFTREHGIGHIVFDPEETRIDGFMQNPAERCYICKRALLKKMQEIVQQKGLGEVLDGSNADDMDAYRPGLIAVAELGVKSPLALAALTKHEIRQLSREMGLPTWQKRSDACLLTRFAHGEELTAQKLKMVEQAEQYILSMGFSSVRVRHHGQIARIEADPAELERLTRLKARGEITACLKALGYEHVTVDLEGYKSGSMDIHHSQSTTLKH